MNYKAEKFATEIDWYVDHTFVRYWAHILPLYL